MTIAWLGFSKPCLLSDGALTEFGQAGDGVTACLTTSNERAEDGVANTCLYYLILCIAQRSAALAMVAFPRSRRTV